MNKFNPEGKRIMNDKGLRTWKALGDSLGITPENCKTDVFRYRHTIKGGCNWSKCPLHLEEGLEALAVEMMRCTGCQTVRVISSVTMSLKILTFCRWHIAVKRVKEGTHEHDITRPPEFSLEVSP